MSGQRAFSWLAHELIDSATGVRFTVLTLVAVVVGLGTMLAVNFGWSVPRFGVIWGPLVAVGSGILAYWLTFVVEHAIGGGLVVLSPHMGGFTPPGDSQPRPPVQEGGTTEPHTATGPDSQAN